MDLFAYKFPMIYETIIVKFIIGQCTNPRTVIAFYHTNGFMWVRWDPHVNELGELGFLPILH